MAITDEVDFTICSPDKDIYHLLMDAFLEDGRVRVLHGSVLDVKADAWVSPANSFGFMNGGIDAQYLEHFGGNAQKWLRSRIKSYYDGEMPVGECLFLDIPGAPQEPEYLIAAPTMRVPMKLPNDSVNVYLATKSVVRELKRETLSPTFAIDGVRGPLHRFVKSIVFPVMGTGVGAMDPRIAIHQMKQALYEAEEFPQTFTEAMNAHQRLCLIDKPVDLQV